ncbi:hypothetical protein HAX54_014638, partial [Datura stramonium]|nr:hypothetical protein [Datura stramonium]
GKKRREAVWCRGFSGVREEKEKLWLLLEEEEKRKKDEFGGRDLGVGGVRPVAGGLRVKGENGVGCL